MSLGKGIFYIKESFHIENFLGFHLIFINKLYTLKGKGEKNDL